MWSTHKCSTEEGLPQFLVIKSERESEGKAPSRRRPGQLSVIFYVHIKIMCNLRHILAKITYQYLNAPEKSGGARALRKNSGGFRHLWIGQYFMQTKIN